MRTRLCLEKKISIKRKWGLLRLQHGQFEEENQIENLLTYLLSLSFFSHARAYSAPSLNFYSPKKRGREIVFIFVFSSMQRQLSL